jgi:replicative DNA helicase
VEEYSKVITQNKKFPCSVDVEAAVLSAFLLDSGLLHLYVDSISIDDFYIDHHRKIFKGMLDLYTKNNFFDFILLKEHLQKFGLLNDFILQYLDNLSENVFSMALLDTYVPILKEKRVLRDIIFSANSIISQCYDSTIEDASVIIDNAEKMFLKIVSGKDKSGYLSLDASIKKVFSTIVSSSVDNVCGITGVGTGFSRLDKMTCGFQPGDLIIIAARPSMGKSAFALCLARNASLQGHGVAFVSLEMSSDQLAMRLLSLDARVCLNSLRSGSIDQEEWVSLTNAAARISDYSIFIDDAPLQSVLDIKTRVRKIFLEKKITLLIVDYLQLLHVNQKFESRHQEVSEISRALKQIAKELNIPVIALSQLSRQVESRTDKRPLLSDLRDSGAIEQDADLILFLYRDVVYNKETLYPDSAEIIIGKQRNGPTGVVNLRYVGEYTLYEEFSY